MIKRCSLLRKYISCYIKKLNKCLVCSRTQKKKFTNQLRNSFEEYIEINPEGTEIQLEIHFGKPEQVAMDFIDSLDKEQLLKEMNRSKIIKRNVMICTALIVLIALTTGIGVFIWNHSNTPEYIYEYKSEEAFIK